jgi:hypothetical protein
MKFFVSKNDRHQCQAVIELLTGMLHTVEVIGKGGRPHVNGTPVATLVAVRKLERCGRTPGQVRRVERNHVAHLGGTLAPWACGEIIAVAPPIDLSSFDRPVQVEIKCNVMRQITTALQAAERERIVYGK